MLTGVNPFSQTAFSGLTGGITDARSSLSSPGTAETGQTKRPVQPGSEAEKARNNKPGESDQSKPSAGGEELTEAEEKEVQRLKDRDREVRDHERAHANVGGPYAGPPQYKFTKGPDGKSYATSGEVKIDASPEREPEQTIRKMDVVIRAALAPAEPSSADYAVARQAQATRVEAQAQLREENVARNEANDSKPGSDEDRDLGGALSLDPSGDGDQPGEDIRQLANKVYTQVQAAQEIDFAAIFGG